MSRKGNRAEGAMRIFGALSGVQEEYLEACEKEEKGNIKGHAGSMLFVRRYGMVAAAVLCVALLGVSYFGLQTGRKSAMDECAPAEIEMVIKDGMADSGTVANNDRSAGAVVEEALEEGENPEYAYAQQKGGQADNGGSADANSRDAVTAEIPAETDDLKQGAVNSVEQGLAGTSGNEAEEKLAEKPDSAEKLESDSAENLGRPDTAVEMTMADARKLSVIGAYIPVTWPKGGNIESVRGTDTAGKESVTITWTRSGSMDSFFLSVSNLGNEVPESVKNATVDVAAPETFDARLYEIPYADTVPEEYREVFLDPVFAKEDFTLECVKSRIVPVSGDSGDTDTPRGVFRVLHRTAEGNYVLLKFNGKGNAEEISQMLMTVEAWK